MFNPFKALGNVVKNSVQAIFGKGPWSDEYEKALAYAPKALDAVKQVSSMFDQTRFIQDVANDVSELIGRKVMPSDVSSIRTKNDLMRATARAILNNQLKDIGEETPEHILNLAIELAIPLLKGRANV